MSTWSRLSATIVALALLPASPAPAQDAVAQFYRGKQINLYIGTSAGRRLRHLCAAAGAPLRQLHPRQSGGRAAEHAGRGLKQARRLHVFGRAQGRHRGRRDLLRRDPAAADRRHPTQHDPSKFIYLGNANNEVFICFARADAPVKTFKDTLAQELIIGATNEGGSSRDFPAMLDNVLGAKLRIVTGYAGSNEIMLAIERNEVQGMCGIGWSSIAAQHPHWLESGFARIIAQLATKGHPTMDKMGVPLAIDFAKTAEDRQVMELIYSQLIFGRPYVLPPGTPPDRVAALRKAFMAALQDKDTLAEAKKMNLDLDALAGEEVQAEVAKAFAMPARIIERAKQALIYKPR